MKKIDNDLSELPDSLLAQLSKSHKHSLRRQILDAIRASGAVASIDDILIHIYRASGRVYKRQTLNAHLYRMVNAGVLQPIGRGVYAESVARHAANEERQ